MFVVI